MEEKEIKQLYAELKNLYNKNALHQKGIKLPDLKRGETYSKNALVLLYLFKNFRNPVSKEDLTRFIKTFYPAVNDVQQARHLGAQSGWYILSGTRGDDKVILNQGEYMLYSVEETYPDFTEGRREVSLNTQSWDELKSAYDFRCVTCGSEEGKNHLINRGTKTKLQKGHMDPNLPLDLSNTIPQCDWCNRAYRNYFCFDNKGRVSKVNDPKFILKSEESIQLKMYQILLKKFG